MTRPGSARPRFVRPRPTLALLALAAFALLLALAAWQLQRLAWKEALLAQLAERMAAPPVAVPAGDAAVPDLDYRRAEAVGRFDHAHEFHLYNRVRAGVAGAHVVTPLLREDGGGIVLVDRGFVPYERLDPATREAGQVAGTVRLSGVLRLPPAPGWLTPDNEPARNVWFRPDPAAMAARLGEPASRVAPYLLASSGPAPEGGPVPVPVAIDLRNDHLGYALTWFALALALAVLFVLYHRRRPAGGGASA